MIYESFCTPPYLVKMRCIDGKGAGCAANPSTSPRARALGTGQSFRTCPDLETRDDVLPAAERY
jgi:hypothetical protein